MTWRVKLVIVAPVEWQNSWPQLLIIHRLEDTVITKYNSVPLMVLVLICILNTINGTSVLGCARWVLELPTQHYFLLQAPTLSFVYINTLVP